MKSSLGGVRSTRNPRNSPIFVFEILLGWNQIWVIRILGCLEIVLCRLAIFTSHAWRALSAHAFLAAFVFRITLLVILIIAIVIDTTCGSSWILVGIGRTISSKNKWADLSIACLRCTEILLIISISVWLEVLLAILVRQFYGARCVVLVAHIMVRIASVLARVVATRAPVAMIDILVFVLAWMTCTARGPYILWFLHILRKLIDLIIHKFWILQLREVYFHYIPHQIIHLSLIFLDLVDIDNLIMFEVLKELLQVVQDHVIKHWWIMVPLLSFTAMMFNFVESNELCQLIDQLSSLWLTHLLPCYWSFSRLWTWCWARQMHAMAQTMRQARCQRFLLILRWSSLSSFQTVCHQRWLPLLLQ